MEKNKQTYYEFFKEKYQFGWVIFILVLHTVAAITEFNSDVPSNGWIPVIAASVIFSVIFAITFYQYKKGDDTRFR